MIAVLGMGEQAKAITKYVLEKTDEFLVTLDIRDYDIGSRYMNRWVHHKVSGTVGESFDRLDLEADGDENVTIINCLPTEHILSATVEAVNRGWTIVDLAGVTEVEREQMLLCSKAEASGAVVIRAAGAAPGIVSSFLFDFKQQFGEELIGVKAFFGGIPKYPDYPIGYIRLFNESGVIKEYSGIAETIEDGELTPKPTLSEREHVFIPSLGIMEADLTSGGISTTLDNMDVDYFSYKTLRYPGHFEYVKKNVLSQPNPQAVLSRLIEPVSDRNPDIFIVHFEVETTEGTEYIEYFWEYDYENNISAMAQITGYVAAEVALQARDMEPGIYNMDYFSPYQIRKKVREIREDNNFSEKPIQF